VATGRRPDHPAEEDPPRAAPLPDLTEPADLPPDHVRERLPSAATIGALAGLVTATLGGVAGALAAGEVTGIVAAMLIVGGLVALVVIVMLIRR
jgi:hypothetical protein